MINLNSTIGEALFTKTQQRVLSLLYGQTNKSFYLNEIVRIADMGKGTVRRELEKLCHAGLLTITKQGNQNHYQANPNNPIFSELVSIVKKTFGVLGIVKISLGRLLNHIDYAFIYGSIAKGNEHAKSDIDLMIVTEDLSYTAILEVLEQAEKQSGRTISPTLYSKNELITRLKNKQSFVTRIFSNDILWIKGEENFAQLVDGFV
jgi:predicted nucleotidyltransferase